MFDIWMGEIELTEVIINLSVLVMLPLQLLLCFKVKKLTLRLLPITILFLFIVTCIYMSQLAQGWDGLGYTVLAVFAAILLLACIIAWGIWFIIKIIKSNCKV